MIFPPRARAAAAVIAALALGACASDSDTPSSSGGTAPEDGRSCEEIAAAITSELAEQEGVADLWALVRTPSCGGEESHEELYVTFTMSGASRGGALTSALAALQDGIEENTAAVPYLWLYLRAELPHGSTLELNGGDPLGGPTATEHLDIDSSVAGDLLAVDREHGPVDVFLTPAGSLRVSHVEATVVVEPEASAEELVSPLTDAWAAASDSADRLDVDVARVLVGPTDSSLPLLDLEEAPFHQTPSEASSIGSPLRIPVDTGTEMDPAWADVAALWLELIRAPEVDSARLTIGPDHELWFTLQDGQSELSPSTEQILEDLIAAIGEAHYAAPDIYFEN